MNESEKHRLITISKGRYYEEKSVQGYWIKLNKRAVEFKERIVELVEGEDQALWIRVGLVVLAILVLCQNIYHLTQR